MVLENVTWLTPLMATVMESSVFPRPFAVLMIEHQTQQAPKYQSLEMSTMESYVSNFLLYSNYFHENLQ